MTELIEKVEIFGAGVEYAMRAFQSRKSKERPIWITVLLNEIETLKIGEMKIEDDNISELDVANFYVSLGRYFESCYIL